MELYNNLPVDLLPFCNLVFKNVPLNVRVWFSQRLNPERSTFGKEHGNLQDWRGMAECLGFSSLEMDNFQRLPDPMGEVMKNFPMKKIGATIGDFLLAIMSCERFDILEEPQLPIILKRYPKINVSPQVVEPLDQDPEIDSPSENYGYLTVKEAETGELEYFHAFVCYTSKDLEFVKEIMHELETKNGVKLCIPERDFLPGSPKHEAVTQLIKERCNRMIIILSPDFWGTEECRFLMLFAFSLDPSARKKKLIPVVYRKCDIPSCLNHITLVDYTRSDVLEWFWSRLSRSLIPTSSFNSQLQQPIFISSSEGALSSYSGTQSSSVDYRRNISGSAFVNPKKIELETRDPVDDSIEINQNVVCFSTNKSSSNLSDNMSSKTEQVNDGSNDVSEMFPVHETSSSSKHSSFSFTKLFKNKHK